MKVFSKYQTQTGGHTVNSSSPLPFVVLTIGGIFFIVGIIVWCNYYNKRQIASGLTRFLVVGGLIIFLFGLLFTHCDNGSVPTLTEYQQLLGQAESLYDIRVVHEKMMSTPDNQRTFSLEKAAQLAVGRDYALLLSASPRWSDARREALMDLLKYISENKLSAYESVRPYETLIARELLSYKNFMLAQSVRNNVAPNSQFVAIARQVMISNINTIEEAVAVLRDPLTTGVEKRLIANQMLTPIRNPWNWCNICNNMPPDWHLSTHQFNMLKRACSSMSDHDFADWFEQFPQRCLTQAQKRYFDQYQKSSGLETLESMIHQLDYASSPYDDDFTRLLLKIIQRNNTLADWVQIGQSRNPLLQAIAAIRLAEMTKR